MRTIPDFQDLLIPLENEIHQTFIPALTGSPPCSKLECDLLGLPVRLGGMGLTNPHPGLQPSQSLTMDSFFTRESSEMPSASDTTGSSRTHHRPAAAAAAEDGARLDIRVRGFWNGAQDALTLRFFTQTHQDTAP